MTFSLPPPPAPGEPAPPADLSGLRDFIHNLDELKEYVGIFLAQTAGDLDILARNCTAGENREWAETAHRMKGTAGMAGAMALHKSCADAQALKMAAAEDRAAALARIRTALEEVRDYLEKHI